MEELDRLIMHLNGDGGIKVDGDPIQLAVDYLKELQHQNDEFGELVDRENHATYMCNQMHGKLNEISRYMKTLIGHPSDEIMKIHNDVMEVIRK